MSVEGDRYIWQDVVELKCVEIDGSFVFTELFAGFDEIIAGYLEGFAVA